jgi:hypothetical protein
MLPKNLTDIKFEKLTCISSIKINKNNKDYSGWLCKCECGNEVNVLTTDLTRKRVRSCGCLRKRNDSDILNIKFGKLTPFESFVKIRSKCKHTYYKCKCDCGNIVETQADKLKSGHTSSCGCFFREMSSQRALNNRKHSPQMVTIKRIFKNYSDGDLSIEDFIELSQKECHYCKTKPYRKFNMCALQPNASEYKKQNGEFIYNGLDRIDSLKSHTKDNVVPCCYKCNKYKSDMSLEEFKSKIKKLQVKTFIPFKLPNALQICENKKIISVAKGAYKATYQDGISFENFYYLSKLNCFYCNDPPSNKINIKNCNDSFVYNGLDRIDSSLDHSISNVVPCCKRCNLGKSKYSLQEFNEWIIKIQNNFHDFQ